MREMQIFGVERLEDRLLMAVDITQNGGNLIITGDDASENIHVHSDGSYVRVHVDVDGDGTEDIDETYSGVTNLTIRTNGGDDYVTVSDLDLSGTLRIETGAGYDEVRVGPVEDYFETGNYYGDVSIGKDLRINTGSEDDEVYVQGDGSYETSIGRTLDIRTQDGDDEVVVRAHGGGGTLDIDGNLLIQTGDGDDIAGITSTTDSQLTLDGNATIKTGAGDDDVGVQAADGSTLDIDGYVTIETGAGYDLVRVNARDGVLHLRDRLTIETGAGDDEVYIEALGGGSVSIEGQTKVDLGGGGDDLRVRGSGTVDFLGRFKVNAQGGDDYVYANGDVYFHDDATFDGGNGYDEIDPYGATFLDTRKIKKFELIV
jgi:hypothetical protein